MPSLPPLTANLLGPLLSAPLLPALAPLPLLPTHLALHGARAPPATALLLAPSPPSLPDALAALHAGEYPACAALTTGYVFRVENGGTVAFLQRVARTGQLASVDVAPAATAAGAAGTGAGWVAGCLRAAAGGATLLGLVGVAGGLGARWRDGGAAAALGLAVAGRLAHVLVLRGLVDESWAGEPEPGVRGDLLVLLSRDRWVRIRGMVDDLKAVTSGQWMREPGGWWEGAAAQAGTVLAYAAAGASVGCGVEGGAVVLGVTMVNWVLCGLAAALESGSGELRMKGRRLKVVGRKKYRRRRVLADELIEETGRDDWAIGLGMIPAERDRIKEAVM